MSHVFGIRPWELGRLTVAEFNRYQAWAENYAESMRGNHG